MKSIEYLIKENKSQYDEMYNLNEKIKNLEIEIVDLNII